MEILIGASLVAAFIAGIAALFAPCCITVLLPAYLGSIFRRKQTVFLMTFVFFLGLLIVFLPLGLGMAVLGQFFSQYHDPLFILGGIFLLLLAGSILFGKHFSLPIFARSNIKISNSGSVFGLGVFSGFATLCCAPVLAGVLALSVLPGSIFWGGMYALTYVLGMVSPLFIVAYFLDKINFTKRFIAFKKQISYSFFGSQINLTLAEIVSGITFLSMGILILYLAWTGQLVSHSSYQTTINIYFAKFTNSINQYLAQIPAIIWIAMIIILFFVIFRIVLRKWKNIRSA